ncbi:AKAP7 2'5' RNA ligase-like domain-containing protein [Chlamydoabsidia padenii]|nr:AKAP7 2'5' RNA ligase-like domain-containing protein [Chlamydoabsidia padenii]
MNIRGLLPLATKCGYHHQTISERLMVITGTSSLTNKYQTFYSTMTTQHTHDALQCNNTKYKHIQPRPTHFLSFPIALPTLSNALLEGNLASSLDPSIMIPHRNLHITAGVLHLPTSNNIKKAIMILQNYCSTLNQDQPLLIDIQQLKVMQKDPRKAHVLYAQVSDRSEQKTLHGICDSIRQIMTKQGYMKNDNRPFKMHVTVINTIYGRKKTSATLPTLHDKTGNKRHMDSTVSATNSKSKWTREPFDATPILESLGQTHWGTIRIDTLHLMKMGRTGPLLTYESVSNFSI